MPLNVSKIEFTGAYITEKYTTCTYKTIYTYVYNLVVTLLQ